MKKYIFLPLFILIPVVVLAGNNYYQTQRYKQSFTSDKAQKVIQPPDVTNQTGTSPSTTALEKEIQPRLAVINIGGFACPSCPLIAQNALKETKGVLDARTTSTGEASRVLYDASVLSVEGIQKALSPAGYTVDRVITDQPTKLNKLD